MKIAIPLTDNKLSSHFGHCEAFAIFITDQDRIISEEVITSPEHEHGSHPRFLHDLGCNVVIAGGMGIKAQEMLAEKGIKVVSGNPELPLRELVKSYLQGKLSAGVPVCDHHDSDHEHHH